MTVKELIEVLDEELENKEIYIFDDDKEKWVPLNKKDLTWPIAVLLSDNDPYEISDCLTFYLDNSFVEEIQPYINLENKVYHERFQFLQRVLNEFEIYKKINIGTDSRERDIEKSFIKNKWESRKVND